MHLPRHRMNGCFTSEGFGPTGPSLPTVHGTEDEEPARHAAMLHGGGVDVEDESNQAAYGMELAAEVEDDNADEATSSL